MYKAEKKVIGSLPKCYCVAKINDRGNTRLLCAAEKKDACFLFDTDGNRLETVWEGPGGVMTIEQFPAEEETVILATQKFYSPNDSADAKIVYYRRDENGAWRCEVLCDLPFVHRFGILRRAGVYYLVACTLKSDHKFKNDWTCPGRVYVAELPFDITGFHAEHQLPLTPLISGLYHNHGFTKVNGSRDIRGEEEGCTYCLIGTDNGVFRIVPPAVRGASWETELMIEDAVSDMLYEDFDGDGARELLTLSPFHGSHLAVYKDGAFVEEPWFVACLGHRLRELIVPPHDPAKKFGKVWDYSAPMPFLHAICAARAEGKTFAVIGNREGKKELLAVRYDTASGEYKTDVLDAGAGPANVLAFTEDGRLKVLAANRESDEIALYEIYGEDGR